VGFIAGQRKIENTQHRGVGWKSLAIQQILSETIRTLPTKRLGTTAFQFFQNCFGIPF
jgi:hypothetical protein